jgi:alpha-L-fucosidase 2
MPASRREFLASGVGAASAIAGSRRASGEPVLNGYEIAKRHCITRDEPTPDFFEGMLLGNGDIGVCITVRPDALGLHIGKSDSWDIRVSEEHASQVLPFKEVLELWRRASDEAKRQGQPDMLFLEEKIPFFREYAGKMAASYGKTWPRPWPCGIIWVHWDAARVRIVQQTLDPASGHFHLKVTANGKPVSIHAFVNTTTGHLCAWSDEAAEFSSIAYFPYLDTAAKLPNPEIDGSVLLTNAEFSAYQRFPAAAPTEGAPRPLPSEKDRNSSLHAVVQGEWRLTGLEEAKRMLASDLGEIDTTKWRVEYPSVTLEAQKLQPLRIDVALFTPRDQANNLEFARTEARRLSRLSPESIEQASADYWREYWSRSAVEFDDKELERWWYHNQYWLGCCLRNGKIAPGLFGNWTSGKIGTAWHGDYHMNYNTQQVFWGVFSSNHTDQHFPYIELVEKLVPMSEKYAKEKFGLPGAYFPHSAYPVPSQVVPYPAPPWGYEICETPWTVQSLWWHYKYTRDEEILRRVYPTLKAAAQFIAAYIKRGDDGKYHVDPTVSPENWGCTVDFRLNRDCIMDLALIDFLLEAVVEASDILQMDAEDGKTWSQMRGKLADYPSASGPQGEIWLDVPNAPVGWIYNIPVTLAPVFPGERIGLHSRPSELATARRTAETIRLEGGNDIVYQPLIRARLGMLDLDWFKQEVRYCLMPNGIVQDRVRQVGGRYRDTMDFDFMMRMGVWTENLSLPAVLNECMLQSYSGTLHIFPNTIHLGPARFKNLRAAGAFLVSASWDGKTVSDVEILSEKGGTLRIINPWQNGELRVESRAGRIPMRQDRTTIEFATEPGRVYSLSRS